MNARKKMADGAVWAQGTLSQSYSTMRVVHTYVIHNCLLLD